MHRNGNGGPPPAPPAPTGGQGGSRRPRGEALLLRTTLRKCHVLGVPISDELVAETARVIAELQASDNVRHRRAGAALAMQAIKLNLNIAVEVDRMNRLDGGQPTENVRLYVAEFDNAG